MSSWLTQEGKGRIEAGSSTAVVMCDENILQTVMHALPDEVEKANITTGFPLQQTSVASLMSMLIDLQTNGHKAGSDKYSLHAVLRVLRHPFSTIISPMAPELIKRLTSDAEAPDSSLPWTKAQLSSLPTSPPRRVAKPKQTATSLPGCRRC